MISNIDHNRVWKINFVGRNQSATAIDNNFFTSYFLSTQKNPYKQHGWNYMLWECIQLPSSSFLLLLSCHCPLRYTQRLINNLKTIIIYHRFLFLTTRSSDFRLNYNHCDSFIYFFFTWIEKGNSWKIICINWSCLSCIQSVCGVRGRYMCQLSGSLIHIFTRTIRQIEIDTICEKLIR